MRETQQMGVFQQPAKEPNGNLLSCDREKL
jgi:hypothetical protein